MTDSKAEIELIRAAFGPNEHPGPHLLVGSADGCEPEEVVGPFRKELHWQSVDAVKLDRYAEALSFFSEAGLRFFLPAYLVADLNGSLTRAEPLFAVTHGFSSGSIEVTAGGEVFVKKLGGDAFINPLRYGAMTFADYARRRMSVFCREEAAAIVGYLERRLADDVEAIDAPAIAASLDDFWRDRACSAPTRSELCEHMESEARYVRLLLKESDD